MRKPQWQLLRDMLYNAPGHALTLKEIGDAGWIRNVPDAAMQARKHGVNITTEYLHANKKIASYVLHEKTPRFSSEVKNHEHTFKETQSMFSDQPTKTKAYDL